MTWEALATAFGVSRRAVHLWANGGRMKEANVLRLETLLAAARWQRAALGLPALPSPLRYSDLTRAMRQPPPPAHLLAERDTEPRLSGRVIATHPLKRPGKG
jgi:hypothetical protein